MFVLTTATPLASSVGYGFTIENSSFPENLLPSENIENSPLADFAQPVISPTPCDNSDSEYSPPWSPLKPFSGEGWSYSEPIYLNENVNSDLENYQVLLVIDTASLIAAGKMRPDVGDMRFSWQGYKLPYWVESGVNTAATRVWVRVPLIPVGGTTIYLRYGNPTVGSANSGSEVFEFFDNFEDGVIDSSKWVVKYGNPSESNGVMALTPGSWVESKYTVPINTTTYARFYTDPSTYTASQIFVAEQMAWYGPGRCWYHDYSDYTREVGFGLTYWHSGNLYTVTLHESNSPDYTEVGRLQYTHTNGWKDVEMAWGAGSVTFTAPEGIWTHTTNVPSADRKPKIQLTEDTTYDVVYVRKFVPTEPSVGADALPPASNVGPIENYWRNSSPFTVTATASDSSGVNNVELWYRYSSNNSTWGGWTLFGTNSSGSYSWAFDAPSGDGFYEFYSIATDAVGNREAPPAEADAQAGVDRVAPSSSLFPLSQYITGALPATIDGLLKASALDNLSGVASVELWYRYRRDNGRPWPSDNTCYGVGEPYFIPGFWKWSPFSADRYGYYEFYPVAVDCAGNREPVPSGADVTGRVRVVRVAKNVVRVAVILAEPSDVNHDETRGWGNETLSSREFFRRTGDELVKYYDEVSYGALAVILENKDIYDAGGRWYKLGKSQSIYLFFDSSVKQWTYSNDFLKDAINAADREINYGNYQAVVIVGALGTYPGVFAHYDGVGYAMEEVKTSTNETAHNPILLSELDGGPGDLTLAHEFGHALGKILAGIKLPDIYGMAGHLGDVDGWDVMGNERWPVHLCSWSKEHLGWLNEQDVGNGWYWDGALPTLEYGDQAPHYLKYKWGLGEIWYIFEVRTQNERYSKFDWDVPGTGLVIYQLDRTGGRDTLNVLKGSPFTGGIHDLPLLEGIYDYRLGGTTRVRVLGGVEEQSTYKMAFSINTSVQYLPSSFRVPELEDAIYRMRDMEDMASYYGGRNTGEMYTTTWNTTGGAYARENENENLSPDLDLHAYALDGRHVGVNYETGEYEIGIPGTTASGDLAQGSE